jgi:hypothetical protein
MKPKNRVPTSPEGWLREIAAAYQDARAAIPFGPAVGETFGEAELFHLAPVVTLKFRGLPQSNARLRAATEAALASYVATRDDNAGVFGNPHLAFAFCYLASHHGLGLLGVSRAEELIEYLERNRKPLAGLISRGTTSNGPLQPTAGARFHQLLQRWRGLRG